MIGEQFELENVVTGVVIRITSDGVRVQVWFNHGNDESVIA